LGIFGGSAASVLFSLRMRSFQAFCHRRPIADGFRPEIRACLRSRAISGGSSGPNGRLSSARPLALRFRSRFQRRAFIPARRRNPGFILR